MGAQVLIGKAQSALPFSFVNLALATIHHILIGADEVSDDRVEPDPPLYLARPWEQVAVQIFAPLVRIHSEQPRADCEVEYRIPGAKRKIETQSSSSV
jgi:hypothetical protein